MTLQLFGHRFSSYTWKGLIPFYENATPFAFRELERRDDATWDEFETRWPLKRFPILVDRDRTVVEATSIIEYLHLHHRGPVALIPDDPDTAHTVRMMDRFFDNYVATPQGRIVFDSMRPPESRDPYGDREMREMLERSYAWLDTAMAGREWAAGTSFSMADCAAAPALFYADWTHRIDAGFVNVHAYRARLLARPSVARCVDDARPFRHYFPLGAPDRD